MPQQPELLGVENNPVISSAPTLATQGFPTKNHRFINIWIRSSGGTFYTDGYAVQIWYYRTGIGWISAKGPWPVYYSPIGAIFYMEPRGSVERVYCQITNIVQIGAALTIPRISYEGITYDSSDGNGNVMPQPLGTYSNVKSNNYTYPLSSTLTTTDGFATNNHRFLNVWISLTGPATETCRMITFFLYNARHGLWAAYRDAPSIQNLTVDNGGMFLQVETRGADRVFISLGSFTSTSDVATYTIEGVTYGD